MFAPKLAVTPKPCCGAPLPIFVDTLIGRRGPRAIQRRGVRTFSTVTDAMLSAVEVRGRVAHVVPAQRAAAVAGVRGGRVVDRNTVDDESAADSCPRMRARAAHDDTRGTERRRGVRHLDAGDVPWSADTTSASARRTAAHRDCRAAYERLPGSRSMQAPSRRPGSARWRLPAG